MAKILALLASLVTGKAKVAVGNIKGEYAGHQ